LRLTRVLDFKRSLAVISTCAAALPAIRSADHLALTHENTGGGAAV